MWYSIIMTADEKAQKTIQGIMDAFTPKYIGGGRPLDMAIFTSHDQDSNKVSLYFSPKTASLAMRFGATPCDSNFTNVTLSLLVGDERSISVLFPDAQEGE